MVYLFTILMFLTIICLVIGLLKPQFIRMNSRKRVGLVFGGFIILFFILVGITAEPVQEVPAITVPEKIVSVDSFDVPNLVGKDIDEIEAVIGESKSTFEPTELQEQSGPITSDKTFVRGDTELTISYDKETRKIVDFFISSDDASGASSDTGHLLEMGNLSQTSDTYTIEFIPAMNDSRVYTGVKVTPK